MQSKQLSQLKSQNNLNTPKISWDMRHKCPSAFRILPHLRPKPNAKDHTSVANVQLQDYALALVEVGGLAAMRPFIWRSTCRSYGYPNFPTLCFQILRAKQCNSSYDLGWKKCLLHLAFQGYSEGTWDDLRRPATPLGPFCRSTWARSSPDVGILGLGRYSWSAFSVDCQSSTTMHYP